LNTINVPCIQQHVSWTTGARYGCIHPHPAPTTHFNEQVQTLTIVNSCPWVLANWTNQDLLFVRNIENLQWRKISIVKLMEKCYKICFFVNCTVDYKGATSNRDFFNTFTTYDGQMKGGKIHLVITFKTCFDDHAWHDQNYCRVE
jgi:hypothetical protein